MPPHAPAVLILLLRQPGVAQHLDVEVKDLEARMMHVELRTLEEEEAVMVNHLLAVIQVQKCGHVFVRLWIVYDIAGLEVEILCEECERGLVVGHTQSKMAKLVDRSWALLESQIGRAHV